MLVRLSEVCQEVPHTMVNEKAARKEATGNVVNGSNQRQNTKGTPSGLGELMHFPVLLLVKHN